jgi:NADP-dependent 3-hydroxy acid dehydrogenase YdfG
MSDKPLQGRVVVVTGASSGIGEATARAVSGAGGAVALLARRKERIEALAGELTDAGGRAAAVTADVTDTDGLERAAQQVAESLGRVDGLVNNAGQMLLSPFTAGKSDEWRRMVEINVLGAMFATDAFLPALCDGGGDLVNISSVAGRKARPTSSVYSATKWGLGGWSEALRQELRGDRVRVTLIEPGAVRTELAEHISDETIRDQTRAMYDDVDALHPDDIANAIVYAISQPARASVNEILIRPTLQEY